MSQQIPGITVFEVANVTKKLLDTRNVRMQIATDRDPPHLAIINTKTTGIATVAGVDTTKQEVLFSMKHKLGYTPKVLLYILNTTTGAYELGTYYIALSGNFTDTIISDVNDTSFSIIHKITDLTSVGVTSQPLPVQLKYLIFSNPLNNYTDPALR